MKRTTKVVAALSAAVLLGAGNIAAHADNLEVEGDSLTTVGGVDILALGEIACGVETPATLELAVRKTANDKHETRFQPGSTVTLGVVSLMNPDMAVQVENPSILIPTEWTGGGGGVVTDARTSTLSVTPSAPGPAAELVTYTATGTRNSDEGVLTLTRAVEVTWTAGECADPNTRPSVPGLPFASESPTKGAFTLSWDASTDAENDVQYILQGKNATTGAVYADVTNEPLTSPDYTFPSGQPAEGRWTYRVKAVEVGTDPALESDFSGVSAPVVVDRTGPHAPSAAADRAPEYTSGAEQWWQSSVTVSFTHNGDPDLADGSSGSGAASVTGEETFSTTGSHTAKGTAIDFALNESLRTDFDLNVDADVPVVEVGAGQKVVQGSDASVGWTASDVGSGLKTDPSGTLTLDTSEIGTHQVPVPAAFDNVGNESVPVTYTYTVVYDFDGFFRPVDMDKPNVAKAGSAIPIKFSLGGDQGLDVLTSAKFVATGGEVGGDLIEETVTAGSSSLSYDPVSDQYVYVWKTSKTWGGRSGILTVTLADGEEHTVELSFRK